MGTAMKRKLTSERRVKKAYCLVFKRRFRREIKQSNYCKLQIQHFLFKKIYSTCSLGGLNKYKLCEIQVNGMSGVVW